MTLCENLPLLGQKKNQGEEVNLISSSKHLLSYFPCFRLKLHLIALNFHKNSSLPFLFLFFFTSIPLFLKVRTFWTQILDLLCHDNKLHSQYLYYQLSTCSHHFFFSLVCSQEL